MKKINMNDKKTTFTDKVAEIVEVFAILVIVAIIIGFFLGVIRF